MSSFQFFNLQPSVSGCRLGEVIVYRLRSGHCRLNAHLDKIGCVYPSRIAIYVVARNDHTIPHLSSIAVNLINNVLTVQTFALDTILPPTFTTCLLHPRYFHLFWISFHHVSVFCRNILGYYVYIPAYILVTVVHKAGR